VAPAAHSRNPRHGRPLATGGKLGLFRSPEPNGEAAPAIFGVFPANKYLCSSATSVRTLREKIPTKPAGVITPHKDVLIHVSRKTLAKMPTSAARRRVSLETARDVGGGGLSEDIPDNRENGRRGLPDQFVEDENAVIRQANHVGSLVHVR
jgi:hypothetical protein